MQPSHGQALWRKGEAAALGPTGAGGLVLLAPRCCPRSQTGAVLVGAESSRSPRRAQVTLAWAALVPSAGGRAAAMAEATPQLVGAASS